MSPIINSAVTRVTPPLWTGTHETFGPEQRGFLYRFDRGWSFRAGGLSARIAQHPDAAEGAGFIAVETGAKARLNFNPVLGQSPFLPWVIVRYLGPGLDITYRLNMYDTESPFGASVQDWVNHMGLLDPTIAGVSLGDFNDTPPDPNNGNVPIHDGAYAVWIGAIAPQGQLWFDTGLYPTDLGPFVGPMFDPVDGHYSLEIPGRPAASAEPAVQPAVNVGEVTMGTMRLRVQGENAV